jgi:hypothetical protein
MPKRQRESKYEYKQGGKLALFDDNEGFAIVGNREGLISLANLIREVAHLPYPKGDDSLYHEHLGFTWSRELRKRCLRIHVGRVPLTPPTVKEKGRGRDVTVRVAKNPWKYLPRKAS